MCQPTEWGAGCGLPPRQERVLRLIRPLPARKWRIFGVVSQPAGLKWTLGPVA